MSLAKSIPQGPGALGRLHVSRLLAALALVAGVLAGPLAPAPAHAVAGDLTCTVKGDITFNPALTASGTSAASIAGDLNACLSPNGNHPNLQSGHFTGTGTATSGGLPCGVILTIPFTVVVTWATSPPSTSTINLTLSTNPFSLSLGGPVTSGQLAGDSVLAVPVLTPNVNCLFVGLTSLKVVSGAFAFN